MQLNADNIELYLFRYKENLLNPDERAEVEQALQSNPVWRDMAEQYDPELTLPAGATVPFKNWESLRDGGVKASRSGGIRIATLAERKKPTPFWFTFAAAACLLLFVTAMVRFWGDGQRLPIGSLTAIVPSDLIDSFIQTNPVIQESDNPTILKTDNPTILKTDNPKILKTVKTEKPQTLLASNESVDVQEFETQTAAEQKSDEVVSLAVPDTLPTIESINKENQKILYADNLIQWEYGNGANEDAPLTRRQQLRNLAKKATTVIANTTANYDACKSEIGDMIEEHIQSNQLLSNILAVISDD